MNRYQNIQTTKSNSGKRMYKTVRYPEVPLSENDTYVYTTYGDRFDTLAQQYYNDSSLWWIISIANDNLTQNSLNVREGLQIRIPANVAEVLNLYKQLNP